MFEAENCKSSGDGLALRWCRVFLLSCSCCPVWIGRLNGKGERIKWLFRLTFRHLFELFHLFSYPIWHDHLAHLLSLRACLMLWCLPCYCSIPHRLCRYHQIMVVCHRFICQYWSRHDPEPSFSHTSQTSHAHSFPGHLGTTFSWKYFVGNVRAPYETWMSYKCAGMSQNSLLYILIQALSPCRFYLSSSLSYPYKFPCPENLSRTCRQPPLYTQFNLNPNSNIAHYRTPWPPTAYHYYSIWYFIYHFILLFHILTLEFKSGSEQTTAGAHRTRTQIYLLIYIL